MIKLKILLIFMLLKLIKQDKDHKSVIVE